MQAAGTSFARSAFTDWTSRWAESLPRAWLAFAGDADERLLGDAADLADLERRLRRLECGREERFAPLPRLP